MTFRSQQIRTHFAENSPKVSENTFQAFDKENPNEVVLALDPSGNYSEGRGTTGYAISNDGFIFCAGQIYAAEYSSQLEYWNAILQRIDGLANEYPGKFKVVCEDYRLYASCSESQINSNLETPQLIGAIKYFCWERDIPIIMQMASEVKNRWSDEVLNAKGWLWHNGRQMMFTKLKIGRHSLDAIRHLMHYNTFKAKTRPKVTTQKTTFKRRDFSDY